MINSVYPATIAADRYNGTYSGALFTAWNCFPNEVPEEIFYSEERSAVFWENANNDEIGKGDTPDMAYRDLVDKMQKLYDNSIFSDLKDKISAMSPEAKKQVREYLFDD